MKKESNNPAYFFEITAFGIFEVSGDNDDEQNRKLLATSSITLLVETTREQLTSLTSHGPWNQITLHLVEFTDLEK